MIERQQGMTPGHPGTGVTHDIPDTCPHLRFKTVNPAVRTGRFGLAEGTSCNAFFSIIHQFSADFTGGLTAMVIPAVKFNHQANGLGFPIHNEAPGCHGGGTSNPSSMTGGRLNNPP